MNAGAKILMVGRDDFLLETRRQVLLALAPVESSYPVEAAKLIGDCCLELLVLCHSLTEVECRNLSDIARHKVHPPKILGLCSLRTRDMDDVVDLLLPFGYGPENLLKAAATMINGHPIRGQIPQNNIH